LGALAAGMIVGMAARDSADQHVLHLKLDAVGYGFLVPVFFITSGMKLDIATLFIGTSGIALAGAFLAAVLVSRLPLMGLNLRVLGPRLSCTLGLFSATTLSLVVALTEIAISHGLMTPAETAPLVAAGMLTVILFPALGLRLVREPN
jgi:Kef-type K+ transport system membrane component KefB